MPIAKTYRGYEISGDLTVKLVKPNTNLISFEISVDLIQDAFHKWVDDQLKLKCSSCESEIMKGDWFLDGDVRQFCTIACACKFNNEFHSSTFAPVLKRHEV